MTRDYLNTIVKHYETCLDKYGDTHLGVDWPNIDDVSKRYKVMLDIIRIAEDDSEKIEILDFGCGAAHLLEYIQQHKINRINYTGLDVSEKFVNLSRIKFPSTDFYQMDILEEKSILPRFDYIIMNGVFTEKRELTFEEMWEYFKKMIIKVFSVADKGVAFNVMSKSVDWEREELFHVSMDMLTDFLAKNISRNFIIRNDYGLYEYTTYLYK